MVQLSLKQDFRGRKMNNGEDLKAKIKDKINENTIPKYGRFAPVSAELRLKEGDALALCVKPSETSREEKELAVSYMNSSTKTFASKVQFFKNRTKLLEYLKDMDIEAVSDELKKNTEH